MDAATGAVLWRTREDISVVTAPVNYSAGGGPTTVSVQVVYDLLPPTLSSLPLAADTQGGAIARALAGDAGLRGAVFLVGSMRTYPIEVAFLTAPSITALDAATGSELWQVSMKLLERAQEVTTFQFARIFTPLALHEWGVGEPVGGAGGVWGSAGSAGGILVGVGLGWLVDSEGRYLRGEGAQFPAEGSGSVFDTYAFAVRFCTHTSSLLALHTFLASHAPFLSFSLYTTHPPLPLFFS